MKILIPFSLIFLFSGCASMSEKAYHRGFVDGMLTTTNQARYFLTTSGKDRSKAQIADILDSSATNFMELTDDNSRRAETNN